MTKPIANFYHALVAVLAGNAAYFLLLRFLPSRARHVPFQIDLGMLLDFAFCLAAFAIVKAIAGNVDDRVARTFLSARGNYRMPSSSGSLRQGGVFGGTESLLHPAICLRLLFCGGLESNV